MLTKEASIEAAKELHKCDISRNEFFYPTFCNWQSGNRFAEGVTPESPEEEPDLTSEVLTSNDFLNLARDLDFIAQDFMCFT